MTSLQALPYQAYLMAYDLDGGKLYDRTRTAFLVHAAALTELALRVLVDDDNGRPAVVSQEPTGDAVLDDLLTQIAAHRRSWKSWLRYRCRQTLRLVEDGLDGAGAITITPGRFGRRRISVLDPAAVKSLHGEVTAVLSAGRPADAVSPVEAALGLLAVTCAVRHVLPSRHDRRAGLRTDELAARLDLAACPLGRVIPKLRMIIVAAQGG